MEQEIIDLEKQLEKLKDAFEKSKTESYEKQPHKHFNKGDWVTDGERIGIVGWTEHKAINREEGKGYMGVSIKNGSLGFLAGAKRDEWDFLGGELLKYFTDEREINFRMTGEEANELRYHLGPRNVNPSEIKTKILDILDTDSPFN